MNGVQAVGRQYPPTLFEVTEARLVRFAKAVGASSPEAALTSPAMYLMIPVIGLMSDPDLGLDLKHLVHSDQSYEYVRPVQSGERLQVAGEIASYSERRGLILVAIETWAQDSEGEVIVRGRSTLLIRPAEGGA